MQWRSCQFWIGKRWHLFQQISLLFQIFFSKRIVQVGPVSSTISRCNKRNCPTTKQVCQWLGIFPRYYLPALYQLAKIHGTGFTIAFNSSATDLRLFCSEIVTVLSTGCDPIRRSRQNIGNCVPYNGRPGDNSRYAKTVRRLWTFPLTATLNGQRGAACEYLIASDRRVEPLMP